jgi:hypothetical protein
MTWDMSGLRGSLFAAMDTNLARAKAAIRAKCEAEGKPLPSEAHYDAAALRLLEIQFGMTGR